MQKKYLLIIALIIFAMAAFYWQDNYFGSGNMQPSFGMFKQEVGTLTESVPQNDFTNESTSAVSVTEEDTGAAPANSSSEVNKLFSHVLKEVSQCLQIKNLTDSPAVEPTLANLLTSVQPALGEATVFTDDWTQTDVRYTDGVTKRIRTEMNYDNPGNPIRYLQLYRLNENNIPEMEEIEPQHSLNPSDEYIASLVAGGNVVQTEKGGRAYFQGGEEMSVIEQDSKLDSFSVTKGNKTINCISLASTASTCQCF